MLYYSVWDIVDEAKEGYAAIASIREAKKALQLLPPKSTDDPDGSPSQAEDEPVISSNQGPFKDEVQRLVAGKVLSMAWESNKVDIRGVLRLIDDPTPWLLRFWLTRNNKGTFAISCCTKKLFTRKSVGSVLSRC